MKDPENISWGPEMHRAASSSSMDIVAIIFEFQKWWEINLGNDDWKRKPEGTTREV
jgi:hypothetical protein